MSWDDELIQSLLYIFFSLESPSGITSKVWDVKAYSKGRYGKRKKIFFYS